MFDIFETVKGVQAGVTMLEAVKIKMTDLSFC